MTYRLVFDVGHQVPEIAIGVAGAVVLIGVIGGGLLAFEATIKAWRTIAVAAFVLALALLFLEQSRSLFFPIGFAAIGTAIDLLRNRVEAFRHFTSPRGTIATVACAFLLVLVAGVGLSKFGSIDLADRLNAGQAVVLEGPVTDFFEVPTKEECFSVQLHRFCYVDTVASPGFHRIRAYGGPINPGLPVRVTAIGNTIVRLEIGEP